MSSALVDFLRSDGVDEDAGDDLSELSEGEDQKGEKLRHDIFNDQYEEIEPDTTQDGPPIEESWVFPTVYKQGAHGDMLSYKIGYNSVSKKVLWLVGRVETGGMMLFSTDVVPTRAQKGSYSKKAYVEAMMRLNLKMKNGFHREIKGKSSLAIPLPMLANKYRPPDPDDSSQGNAPTLPLAAQSKLDGERHLVRVDPETGEVQQFSRQMNRRYHFEHIQKESAQLLEFLPSGTILDGELYSPKLGFQLITSIAGSKTDSHAREKELDYYVFDIYHPDTVWRPGISKKLTQAHKGEGDAVEGMVYARASGYTVENYSVEAQEYFELPQEEEEACVDFNDMLEGSPMWVVELRIMLLMNAFRCFRIKYRHWPRHVKLVKTYIVHKREDIQKLFGEMRKMEIGGPEKLEGIMLRQLSRGDSDPIKSLYRPGRSNNLLKVKGLQTTEVVITGVRPGRGKAKDLATLVYKEPGTGMSGTVVPAATHVERRQMLLDPHSVKGRTMTVSFQNRMTSGALRFPVGVAFVN
jgi:hypothetical protein